MKKKDTIAFKLAKLMIAVSWVDGVLDDSEIDALKDVLFSMPDLNALEWAEIEIYMDSPVNESERDLLLEDVLASVDTIADRHWVLRTIEALIAVDGNVSREERDLFLELKKELKSSQTGVLGLLSKLTGGFVRKKRAKGKDILLREQHQEIFIHNKILYDVKRMHPEVINISEDQLKKLTSAAALLGRVAAADNDFSLEEHKKLISVLISGWNLSEPDATLLAEIVKRRAMEKIDYHYLTLGFFELTTPEERSRFIKCLFQMANVTGGTSSEEIKEIRTIANSLKVSHSDFIDAKLTIPDRDRYGL